MNDPFQLVTNCNFKGKDYLVQMCVLNSKKLEIIITDKIMAEDWQCEYDAPYIEALTHKTGNFKQFDVFVMMLKSGLLKTSDCISLDLLTLEDLEQLRCKKIINSHSSSRTNQSVRLNRRYLILTYTVEFDRIHYPLPLDYCGPPDPTVLQNNIRRLENEIERLKHKNFLQGRSETEDIKKLKEKLEKCLKTQLQLTNFRENILKLKKIQTLVEENKFLTNEIDRLNKLISKRNKLMKNNPNLLSCLRKLEEQVLHEKTHNRQIIFKLKAENKDLKQQIEELIKSEKLLKLKLRDASRYNSQKSCRRFLRNSLSPENAFDRKRSPASRRLDTQLSGYPVPNWNNPSITKPHVVKTLKKSKNRFLSSSSSESQDKLPHRARSREKKSPLGSSSLKKNEAFRKSSDRSRHSSLDSKRNVQTQRSRLPSSKATSCQEGKSRGLSFIKKVKSHTELRSRESSMSSRASSKNSKLSQFSNKGSGDCIALSKKVTPRSILDEKEELKFSMSDLEARIHSLQKLLSEGMNF